MDPSREALALYQQTLAALQRQDETSALELCRQALQHACGHGLRNNLALSGTGPLSGLGNALDNRIIGNSGANILDGGAAGTDVLTGGGGADQFRFSSLPLLFSSAAADRITDFNPSELDRIRIHRSPSRSPPPRQASPA